MYMHLSLLARTSAVYRVTISVAEVTIILVYGLPICQTKFNNARTTQFYIKCSKGYGWYPWLKQRHLNRIIELGVVHEIEWY